VNTLKELIRLFHYIRKLGVKESVAQLEGYYYFITYGLEEMYQEELRRNKDRYSVQDPEHLFGQTG
jgi:hypothetical protein